MVVVGADRDDLRVRDGDLRIERGELQVLLVLFWAVVAAREGEDQRILTLQLAQRALGVRVIWQLVVGKRASRHDVRAHGRTQFAACAGTASTSAKRPVSMSNTKP